MAVMGVKKYRKKPVEIEAIQFRDNAETISRISTWVGDDITIDYGAKKATLKIKTLEGIMTATPGDYIVKGIQGEFYPCKPEIFEASYQEI